MQANFVCKSPRARCNINLSQSRWSDVMCTGKLLLLLQLLIDNDGQLSKMSGALLACYACRLLLHTSRFVF